VTAKPEFKKFILAPDSDCFILIANDQLVRRVGAEDLADQLFKAAPGKEEEVLKHRLVKSEESEAALLLILRK